MKAIARTFASLLLIAILSSPGAVAGSGVRAGPVVPAVAAAPAAPAPPTIERLIGQKLVIRIAGTTPSAGLLGRIGRGEIGGVILFGWNVTTRSALTAMTGKLQAAAAAGGQPPLLIAVDQEGGSVRRIPWAPPTLSARRMGQIGGTSTARSQGARTAAALHALGINVDFAPVADVPVSTASFMYQAERTFSFDAARTARLADAFASGLESGGVVPAMKHFPGIGLVARNTDRNVETIRASPGTLAPGLLPYRTAIGHHIPMIMLSNARYTAYDRDFAAGWSPVISGTLLRRDLGFKGVTITDSLNGAAAARGLTSRELAERAARAGTDMILLTGSEASTKATWAALVASAKEGSIPEAGLIQSYNRIVALKANL